MGKNFAQKIATMLLSLAMVFSCLFVFTACKDKDDPADEVKVTSISVALAEGSAYTLEENVLNAFYNGEKLELTASDFVVTANKSNNTTAELSQKTNSADGYTLTSTVPTDDVTPVGEYKLTFAYTGVSSVEIQVKVNKGNIDVSGVTLKSLTYNGAEQTLQTADILNLPENVTAEFISGNYGTDAHNYDAVVRFTYTGADAESYNAIPDATITWTMEKANYNVSNVSWVRGANTVYTGLAQTVEIAVDGELPEGVTIKGYLNNEFTNAGNYTAKVQFEYDTLNYNKPAVADFEWEIEKAPLTVKANNSTIIFGEAATNDGVTYTGFVNGETKDVLGGELSYEYGAYHIGSNVDTYDIVPSGLSANNYEITYQNGELVVNKAQYNYTDISWVYEGPYDYNNNAQKPTVTGVPELVGYAIVAKPSGSETEDESVNAGSYTAVFTVLSFDNYEFAGTVPTMSYVINKVALSITANDNTITFGDEPSHSGVLAEGFKGADNLDIFAGQIFEYSYDYAQWDDAGEYTITVAGVTSVNYDITFHTGTLTVQAITLQYSSIEFNYTEAFDYDGTEKALTVTGVPAYVENYTITYTKGGSVATPKNAGTYVASFMAQESNNYVYMGQVPTQEFVINKVALVITANNKEISFGSEPTHAGVTYNGFVAGENELELDGELLYTYGEYEAGADIGEYVIEISGLTADNYEISYVSGKLTVNPLQVNVSSYSWNYTSLTYSGVAQEPTLREISPYISANYAYTQNDAPAYPINVGSYKASVTFNTSKNYEVVGTVADLTFAIGKKTLFVTANDHIITYQDAAANDGVTYDGFVGGETEAVLVGELVFDYDYEQGDNVGSYTITPSGLTSSNYDIQFVEGTLIVEELTVALSNFAWNYENAYTYSGVAQKPTLTTYPEYLTFESYTYLKDTFDDESINAGTYRAIATFAESDNYEIEGDVAVDYVINKTALVVTANDHEITYLDNAANNSVRYSGFVNDETFADLQGTLAFDYEGYVSGRNAGAYRITPSGYTSNNYEISYVAGLLTVQAITHNYNEISFNHTGEEEFVYNGTAVEFVASGVPSYVTYDIVYKENDTTVVDEAVDAGTYSATFVPQTSVNYIFVGEPLKVTFTIDKATIDESELYFTIDGAKVTAVKAGEEGQPSSMIVYEVEMYYDGEEHLVDFVNNTGVEGVTFNFTAQERTRTIKNISLYNLGVELNFSANVLKNYEAVDFTQYVIKIRINDFMQGYKLTYMPENGITDEHIVKTDLIPFAQENYKVNGLILDIEFVYADEELESVYTSNIYTDKTFGYYVTDNITDLNVFDNTLYVGTNIAGKPVFDSRTLKFELTFSADTYSDAYTDVNQVEYKTTEQTIKSINVETETIQFYNNSTMFGVVEKSCEVGYIESVPVLGEGDVPVVDGEGHPVIETREYFTSEAHPIHSGVNELLIRYNYIYDGSTYSYTRKVNIVYSLSSTNHFTITYKSDMGDEPAVSNSITLSDVSMEDILGDDPSISNPMTAIEEICEKIEIEPLSQGNYELDETRPRQVQIMNGNAYLVIYVNEKEKDDGSIDFKPGYQSYSYTETGDESGDMGDVENGESIIPLEIWIHLNFGFDVDYNTNASINSNAENIQDYGLYGLIQMRVGQYVNVITENQDAAIMVMNMEDMGGDEPPSVPIYYGQADFTFDEVGEYCLIIMPTISVFGEEYEPKIFMIEVVAADGEFDGFEEYADYSVITFIYNDGNKFLASYVSQTGDFSGDFEEISREGFVFELTAEMDAELLKDDTFVFDGIALGDFFVNEAPYFIVLDAVAEDLIELEPYDEMGEEVSYIGFSVPLTAIGNIISVMIICYEDETMMSEMGRFIFTINFVEAA